MHTRAVMRHIIKRRKIIFLMKFMYDQSICDIIYEQILKNGPNSQEQNNKEFLCNFQKLLAQFVYF